MLGSIKLKIDNIASGVHEFVGANFVGNNYSVLNLSIHSVLSEYRYRIINKPISEISENEIYNLIFKSKEIPDQSRKLGMTKFILSSLSNESIESFCSRLIT